MGGINYGVLTFFACQLTRDVLESSVLVRGRPQRAHAPRWIRSCTWTHLATLLLPTCRVWCSIQGRPAQGKRHSHRSGVSRPRLSGHIYVRFRTYTCPFEDIDRGPYIGFSRVQTRRACSDLSRPRAPKRTAPLQEYLTYKKRTPVGPYRRPMPRVLGGSWGGGRLMGKVPLYTGMPRVQTHRAYLA